jgi:hypothetical protein
MSAMTATTVTVVELMPNGSAGAAVGLSAVDAA